MDVRMPDGTLVRNVPDDATKEDIAARLGSINTPTSTANKIQVQNDLPPQVGSSRYNPQQSTLGYVGNEVGKAALGMVGLPAAMVNAAAGSPTPLGPISALSNMVRDKIGIPTISKIGQILGLEPDMKAPGPGTSFLTGAGIDVAQNMLFPGGSTAQKVASGVGSFLGRTSLQDLGPGGEAVGSMAGGVLAPSLVATRIGALNAVRNASKGTLNEFVTSLQNNPATASKVRQDVLNELADSLRKDPETYAAKFAAAQELEKAIPGLKLNVGQSFMAPSVLQKQRALESSSPLEMNAAQARRNANEKALRGALGESQGAASQAGAVVDELSAGFAKRSRELSAEIDRLSSEASSIAAKVARSDVQELGAKALDIRASELGKARSTANQLMAAATNAARTEGAQFDPSAIVGKAKQILQEPVWDDANATSVFGKIKGFGRQEEPGFEWNPISGSTPKAQEASTFSFDDIKEMRQAVNADIASALRSSSPNARAQLRNLEQLKSTIDRTISDSGFEGTKSAYSKFVDYYRSEFAPRFLRGVNLMAEKTTSTGEPRLPAEKVFSSYFKRDGATEMSRYLRLYGENTEAMSAMRDAITDRYAKEVVKDGAIVTAAHKSFMDKYRLPLAALDRAGFKFANDLQDASKSYASVVDRLASVKASSEMADKDLARRIISDQFGAKTPEQIVGEVMGDPRKMDLLMSRMNTEQARGFVEFVRDDLVRQFTDNGVINPKAISAFLADRNSVRSYRSALAKVYSGEVADSHIDTIRRIQDAAQRLDATPVPQMAAVQGKPSLFRDEMQKRIGLSIPVIGNMLRAVVAGRVSPEWAALSLGAQAGATVMQKMQNAVYEEMLKDPQTAKLLLEAMRQPVQSGAGSTAVIRVLKKIPRLTSYFIGLDKYKDFAKYGIANTGRALAEPNTVEEAQ